MVRIAVVGTWRLCHEEAKARSPGTPGPEGRPVLDGSEETGLAWFGACCFSFVWGLALWAWLTGIGQMRSTWLIVQEAPACGPRA